VTAPVTVRERDLCALAGIVSEDRPDVPRTGEGLPLSLLAELMGQIRCDTIAFQGFDCQRKQTWFVQAIRIPTKPGMMNTIRCTGSSTGNASSHAVPCVQIDQIPAGQGIVIDDNQPYPVVGFLEIRKHHADVVVGGH
jgi:hypothetical protein